MPDNSQGSPQTELVAVQIPKVLFERISVYCNDKGLTTNEFLIDALSQKLQFVYKEKRKKPRL